MLFGETIRVAFASLRANTLRSGLTMFGIVIGVAAVIAMIALGTGAENAVQNRIQLLGRRFCGSIRNASFRAASERPASRSSRWRTSKR
jgi:hypothetical protein